MFLKKIINTYRIFSDEDALLIYQMGKVGSTALEKSLPKAIHIHTLYGTYLCEFYHKLRYRTLISRLKCSAVQKAKRIIIKRRNKIKIITLVRDPLNRDISHYFQDIQYWLTLHNLNAKADIRDENIDALVDCFEHTYNFDYARNWFENEVSRFCKMNVTDIEFDKVRGIGYLNKGKFEILVIRMDKLDGLEDEISKFANKKIVMRRVNDSSKKWYSEAYKDFRTRYVPSDDVLNKIFSSPWLAAFFSSEDIESWKKEATASKAKSNT